MKKLSVGIVAVLLLVAVALVIFRTTTTTPRSKLANTATPSDAPHSTSVRVRESEPAIPQRGQLITSPASLPRLGRDPMTDLLEDQAARGIDEDTAILEQFMLVARQRLGGQISPKQYAQISAIEKSYLAALRAIDVQADEVQLPDALRLAQVKIALDAAGVKFATILTDLQYRALFDVGKESPLSEMLEHPEDLQEAEPTDS